MPLLTAPIMAKFVEDYGCKRMTVIGGAISAFGFVVSSLCKSVDQLYLTVGVVGGSGLSAAYIVGLVSVEQWFEARRSLAIGIVSAGTGFGSFIFPPLTKYCLDTLEWKTTMLIFSAILSTVSIIGFFLKSPHSKTDKDDEERTQKKVNEGKIIPKFSVFLNFSHFCNLNFLLLQIGTFIIYAFFNTAIYFLTEMLRKFHLEKLGVMCSSTIGMNLFINSIE